MMAFPQNEQGHLQYSQLIGDFALKETATTVRQYFFDRALTIQGGTTEIQKNVIATRVLGI